MGAIRLSGWVQLSTAFETTNADRFVTWLKKRLLPKLKPGDVLIMDNLRAHHDARVSKICRNRGVEPMYQPPYSPDFNPIEPGWALQNNLFVVMPREHRRTLYELREEHAIESPSCTASNGSDMLGIRINTSDHWV